MEYLAAARAMRDPIVDLGGAFMTSPQLAAEEERLGMWARSLYFRGRSAVLGDPPAAVVASLFGIFPAWLIELMLGEAAPVVAAGDAIRGYTRACGAWGSAELPRSDGTDEATELLYRVVDGADLTALPLVAGWQIQERPLAPAERFAHALMLARELRGGLHFAALRASGLSVPEAVVADPHAGLDKMLRTGWQESDADAVITRARARPDLHTRWRRAEETTGGERALRRVRQVGREVKSRRTSWGGLSRTSVGYR
ncbi:hypothetical protein C8K36_1011353 [Rhodococcus sp. OK519]|uniref:SCO6745 family protein n=1 Tax=Rhodococcus sp. OK519 TaxID=2135729 RepID=UPI000D38B1AD|nr:hypothetical protein C8K36_1011353 [Rhodococcus sp. OK519]